MFEKLNMVIGVFFSSAEIELLRRFSSADDKLEEIRSKLEVEETWDDSDFRTALETLKRYEGKMNVERIDLEELKKFLSQKMDLLIRLLENPVLIEHESFTQMLQAVFHLAEELNERSSLRDLPESDLEHLKGDIERAYRMLIVEWVKYMQYIKRAYPYLFSLAMRRNPFRRNISVIVR